MTRGTRVSHERLKMWIVVRSRNLDISHRSAKYEARSTQAQADMVLLIHASNGVHLCSTLSIRKADTVTRLKLTYTDKPGHIVPSSTATLHHSGCFKGHDMENLTCRTIILLVYVLDIFQDKTGDDL